MKCGCLVGAATALLLGLVGCGPAPIDPQRQVGPDPYLPPLHQYLLPPMHLAKVVGWNGATPTVAPGLKVQAFATGLANPRSLYVLPNGDVLVVETGGWPYSYYGQHIDPRVQPQRPDLVAQAITPDYALSSHVAPLGGQGALLIADDTGNSVWRVSAAAP